MKRTLSSLFVVAAGLVASPVHAQLAPLSEAAQRAIAAIPDEGTPEPTRHYPVTNEYRHDLLEPHLRGLGGIHVGVGSDQNYTIAAMTGAELLLLVDYDPRIPLVHRIYEVLVRASSTRGELIDRFSPERAAESRALLERELASDPRRDAVVRHFRRVQPWIFRFLRRMTTRTFEGRPVSWIGDDRMYERVRALFAAGRVISHNGDVTAERTVSAIGDAARHTGLPVRTVYFSNAEQFFRYTASFLRNMEGLPTDDRSIVVRTVGHRRLAPPVGCPWHYVVQAFPDFVDRLRAGYRHSFALVGDIVSAGAPHAGRHGLSTISASTPRRMLPRRSQASTGAAQP